MEGVSTRRGKKISSETKRELILAVPLSCLDNLGIVVGDELDDFADGNGLTL